AQGQTESVCNFYNTTAITNDMWWVWTPTRGGPVTLTTCGQTVPTATDTKVAIYPYPPSCPAAGTGIACNDDEGYPGTLTCSAYGFNSTVTWTATCGQQYLIQLGNY